MFFMIHRSIVCMPLLVLQALLFGLLAFCTSLSTADAAAIRDEVSQGVGRIGEDW